MYDFVWSMRRTDVFRIVKRCFSAAQNRFGMRITHFSVQGRHFHLIAEGVDKTTLRKAITGLNVRLAIHVYVVVHDDRGGTAFTDRWLTVQ